MSAVVSMKRIVVMRFIHVEKINRTKRFAIVIMFGLLASWLLMPSITLKNFKINFADHIFVKKDNSVDWSGVISDNYSAYAGSVFNRNIVRDIAFADDQLNNKSILLHSEDVKMTELNTIKFSNCSDIYEVIGRKNNIVDHKIFKCETYSISIDSGYDGNGSSNDNARLMPFSVVDPLEGAITGKINKPKTLEESAAMIERLKKLLQGPTGSIYMPLEKDGVKKIFFNKWE